jgi:hypothetical protein
MAAELSKTEERPTVLAPPQHTVLGRGDGIATLAGVADTLLDPFNVRELCDKVAGLLGKGQGPVHHAGGECAVSD